MQVDIRKIKSRYIIQKIFQNIPFHRTIKIVKYSKKITNKLDYLVDDIKNFLFFNKIIKPISNCEGYLPIIKRILSNKKSNINIINSFCHYLNKNNNEFIPQISQIKGNEDILNNLDSFKIGFNTQISDYFYDDDDGVLELNFDKLSNFCKKYGKKIKEITFMDNKENNDFDLESLFIFKYIIINSDVQKIEDRYIEAPNIDLFESELMSLFYLDNDDIIFEYVNEKLLNNIYQNKMNDKIKGLKAYSLYFDKISSYDTEQILFSNCLFESNNGQNIECLEMTKIDKPNRLFFAKSLKNFTNLKKLVISLNSDKKLYNSISKRIKKDSLKRLEINIKSFKDAEKIIKKNSNSLMELTLKIKNIGENNIEMLKTLSNIENLVQLKIISNYLILNEVNIKYFCLQKVEYLEIPLYINKLFVDFKIFFENIPNLKKLYFNGIKIKDNQDIKQGINNTFQLGNFNFPKNLKKIKFHNCPENSSFFIIKFIETLSKRKIKENIKEIKIKNCDFENVTFNYLFILISSFTNIKKLSLNNISFKASEPINYEEINNFDKLEKFNFKGLNYEENEIKILFFLYKLSEKCQRLIELGFSCKGLNPYDMNLILKIIKNYKLLTRLNIFDNYSKYDYFTNKEEGFYQYGIDIEEIINYCMFDLKNIDFKKEKANGIYKSFKRNKINKFFLKKEQYKKISNQKENYFIFENIFNDNLYLKKNNNKLFYSAEKKSFIIGNIDHFKVNDIDIKKK